MTDTTPPTAQESQPQPAAATTAETDAPEPLREAGQQALRAERQARKAAEKAATEALAQIKAFEDREKTELQKAQDAAQKAAADLAEARAEALRLRVAAEEQIPADLHEFLVGDDEEQLRGKAQKLKAATAAADGTRRPAPDPTQGAKPRTGPDQLTRADLARMTPQQIVDAQNAGRLDDLMAGRTT